MLISLSVENFKSFDNLVTFNMIGSNKLRGQEEKLHQENGISILKSAVIYGANASGKSNLVDAFQFMQFALLSTKGMPSKSKHYFCKNKLENAHKITTFEIRMCIDGVCYAYGFDVLLQDSTIKSEWVIELTKDKKEHILFKRDNQQFMLSEKLNLDENEEARFRFYFDDLANHDSVLFLSEMNRNKRISTNPDLAFIHKIYRWFYQDLTIITPDAPFTNFAYYYEDASLKLVENIIKTFDTGITGIHIRSVTTDELQSKMPKEIYDEMLNDIKEKAQISKTGNVNASLRFHNEFFNISLHADNQPIITTLSFEHGEADYQFGFWEESDGTRRIFDLLDILLSKNKQSVYIIDEMERSLHPALTKHFIELLNEYHKQNDIQLIFTTHEATIMTQELFRRDQIWFITRDNNYQSKMYPLDRFNERYDKKISKAYLEGRYGAIPIFQHFSMEDLQ